MKQISQLIMMLFIVSSINAQPKPYKYIVNKGCSTIYVKTDSLPEKALKQVLFDYGFTFELSPDGFWKTTNSIQFSVMPLFFNGSIIKSDTGNYIVVKGQQDDSYYANIAVGAFTGLNANTKSLTQIKCEGMPGSINYKAFNKMVQIAEKMGELSFATAPGKPIKLFEKDILKY